MKIDISKLKKIDIKDINIKELKNRKELLLLLFIVIFIVSVLLIGNNLLAKNKETHDELDVLVKRYESILQREDSVEVLNSRIAEVSDEIAKQENAIVSINELEIINILDKMQSDLGVKWDKDKRTISDSMEVADVPHLRKFKVNIPSFNLSYEKAKALLEYVDDLGSRVSVESLVLSEYSLTGEMRGSLVLNFYMEETAMN